MSTVQSKRDSGSRRGRKACSRDPGATEREGYVRYDHSMAQPLPPNPFTINSSTDMDKRYLAYNEALELERGSPNRSDVQIQARVLGYLLIYLDEQAQLEVGRNIKDCFSQSLQLELAQFYVDILIRACACLHAFFSCF